MKYTDIAKKSVTDLQKDLAEKREALRTFRFSLVGAGTKDVNAGKKARKIVAQTLTALREKAKQGKV